MNQLRIPAVFARGGTSKALILHERDLPHDKAMWSSLFLRMLGSPDRFGRQLNGMGGGLSSLSKICVVAPSKRDDADVDYTFAQVSVTGTAVDYSGNCGNMSSAIGPFAYEENLVPANDGPEALVRIYNTNTGKLINSRFKVNGDEAAIEGDFAMPGVDGVGAPVDLAFLDPASTQGRGLLPTKLPQQALAVEEMGNIAAMMVDAAVPTVFVRQEDICDGELQSPAAIDSDAMLCDRLERVRRAASVAMGIATSLDHARQIIAIPKIAMIAVPADYRTISGEPVSRSAYDLRIQMMSAGQAHRAVPITGALASAAAAVIDGGLVAQIRAHSGDSGRLRLGTPSGIVEVGASISRGAGDLLIKDASVVRTQRRLMEGFVRIRPSDNLKQEINVAES